MDKVNILNVDRVWLNTRDCMNYLGVSRDFVDDLRESGKLAYYKVGHTIFVKKEELDRLIENCKVIDN